MWSSSRDRARLWTTCDRERARRSYRELWQSLKFAFFPCPRMDETCSVMISYDDHETRWIFASNRETISRGVAREMAGHVRGWNHVRAVGAKGNDRISLRFSTTRCWSWKLINWLGRCVARTEHVRQCGGVVIPAISCGARFSSSSFWSAAAMDILIYSSAILRSWSF